MSTRLARLLLAPIFVTAALTLSTSAQTPAQTPAQTSNPQGRNGAPPAFDPSSIDATADPCNDFYKFACGNFAKNHPIPADQTSTGTGYLLYNANTEKLNGILLKAAAGGASRSAIQQKVGDYYAACLDTNASEAAGLAPIQPLLDEIAKVGKLGIPELAGKLQRIGVNVFFSYGEMQDFKDATKQIAALDQGGLGLPEKDYYLRTGDKDRKLRDQYSAHITKMLAFAGAPPQVALRLGSEVLAFETALANASQSVTDRRKPENIYHLEPIAQVEKSMPFVRFNSFLDAIHSPHVAEINVMNPDYMPALLQAIRATDIDVLRAYMRYQLLSTFAGRLPARFDDENFDFFGRTLNGQPQQRPRWKRCADSTNGALGEALGQLYVQQYFAGNAKAKTLEMVLDIEHAMERDLNSLDWMTPATRVRAVEKLHAVANKIGYPDKWRDYSSVTISPTDPVGNAERTIAFENDRQLARIGKPVDKTEWSMTPPTVDAYYDPSMNNINFPAGILQPPFYDPNVDDALNYGHIGAVIGHEITHGFDDEGKKFDAKGNLSDWWTAEDTRNFEARTDCVVNEYSAFTAVDDVKVNGRLTLGENTADNGGLLIAFMAYMDRAKKDNINLNRKVEGYTPAQRFYIAYGQNWCQNVRDEAVRTQVQTDPHSPAQFRVDGVIPNQPGFAPAFGCKAGAPMAPTKTCRVW